MPFCNECGLPIGEGDLCSVCSARRTARGRSLQTGEENTSPTLVRDDMSAAQTPASGGDASARAVDPPVHSASGEGKDGDACELPSDGDADGKMSDSATDRTPTADPDGQTDEGEPAYAASATFSADEEEAKEQEDDATRKQEMPAARKIRRFLCTENYASHFTKQDREENMVFAAVSYLFFLFLIPLLFRKKSPFARFHAMQGVGLFVCELVGVVICAALRQIPLAFFGWMSTALGILFSLICIAYALFGILTSTREEARPLPLIGKFFPHPDA